MAIPPAITAQRAGDGIELRRPTDPNPQATQFAPLTTDTIPVARPGDPLNHFATVSDLLSANNSALLHARVSLSAAQILTLGATPVTIVPAPGPNLMLLLVQGLMTFNFNTVAYTASNSTVSLIYSSDPTLLLTSVGTTGGNFLTATSTVSAGLRGTANSNFQTSIFNAAIQASIIAGPNPAAGDGTIDIDLFYIVVAK